MPQLDVDPKVERVAELLADFDADLARPWGIPRSDRGGDALLARLADCSDAGGGPTILYWVGHGWSDRRTAALAHARGAK